MGDNGARPAPRTQEERRREAETRLLRAAAQLIADHGLPGMTLAAVGTAAGYSRGIVSHHFGSKAALIERLAALIQERFVASTLATAGSHDEIEQLVALQCAYLDGMRARPAGPADPFHRAFVVMWGQSAAVTADLRPTFAAGDERSRTLIGDLVRSGQAHHRVRPDVDPDAVAAIILGQVRGLAMQVLVAPGRLDIDAVTATVLDLTRRLLDPRPARLAD